MKNRPCLLTLKYGSRLWKLLRISYLEHKTNDWVQSKINFFMGSQESFLATVKRRKLAWFWHVTRQDSQPQNILQGTLEGRRRRGRQRKCWMDHIEEWTSLPMPELPTRASCRKDWKGISAESVLMSPPTTQSVKGLNCEHTGVPRFIISFEGLSWGIETAQICDAGKTRPRSAVKAWHEAVTHLCVDHAHSCLTTAFQSECTR